MNIPTSSVILGGHVDTTNLRPLESRYVLMFPIGQGTTGLVWRARRRDTGLPAAVKVLRRKYATEPAALARFLAECAALRRLGHPNLVPVDDVVAFGDTVAAVMEFVDGADLRRVAQRGGLDRGHLFAVLAQVAHALAEVHAAGLLHRDVKPENIVVTRCAGQPVARLTDFGLAALTGDLFITASHVVGTPAYLAPELLTSRPYGPAVDVYALGVTAHELLSGRRPFEASHPLALLRAHVDEQPRPSAGLPADAWRVVTACLAKRPSARPSASEVAAEFENLRDGPVLLDPEDQPAQWTASTSTP